MNVCRPGLARLASLTLLLALALALPAGAAADALILEDGAVHLGRAEVVEVTLVLEGEGPMARTPRVAVSAGRVEGVERISQGRYRVVYRLPESLFPQEAVLAAWWDAGGPAPKVAAFRVSLIGETTVPVTTRPRSMVLARVGGELFGPVEADDAGRALVTVSVPPGATEILVEAEDATGVLTRRTVGLEVPAHDRLVAAGLPSRLPTRLAPAQVELYFAGGAPAPELVQARAELGSLTPLRWGPHRIVYAYRTPTTPLATGDHLSFSVQGEPESVAELVVEVQAPAAPPPPRPPALAALHLGLKAGLAHRLSDGAGGRLAVEARTPVRLGGEPLTAGVVLGYGTSTLRGDQATSRLVPVNLRLSRQVLERWGVALEAGGGLLFAWTRVDAAGQQSRLGFGTGLSAFAAATTPVGPGQVVLEAGFAFAPAQAGELTVETGGLNVELGYRLRIF